MKKNPRQIKRWSKNLITTIGLTSCTLIANATYAQDVMTIDQPENYIHDVWLRDNDRLNHFTSKTFYPSNVLRITATDDYLTLFNDAPLVFTNMVYVAKLANGTTVDLLNVSSLPAISELRFTHPIHSGFLEYQITGTEELVTLTADDFIDATYDYIPQDKDQQNARPNLSTISFKFRSRLFHQEDFKLTSSVKWRPETPNAMRYMLGAIINWSKIVGSEEFEQAWMDTPFLNVKAANPAYKWNTETDYAELSEKGREYYDEAFSRYDHDYGKFYSNDTKEWRLNTLRSRYYNYTETGGGGWGGGATLGVSAARGFFNGHFLYDERASEHYDAKKWYGLPDQNGTNTTIFNHGMEIYSHEAGHTIGGGHYDNFCNEYSDWGINPLTKIFLAGFIKDGKMLINEDNIIERNLLWESNRKDKRPNSAAPFNNSWQPIEWGGIWGHHNIELPYPNKTMDIDSNYIELFRKYVEAHNEGKGLEYLKTLPFNQDVKYHPEGAPKTELSDFQRQGEYTQFGERTLTNVALNKPVSATTARSHSPVVNSVDGDTSTRFISSRNQNQELTIDLTKETAVRSIVVHGVERERYKHRMNGAVVSAYDESHNLIWQSEPMTVQEGDEQVFVYNFAAPLANVYYVKFRTDSKNIEVNEIEVFE